MSHECQCRVPLSDLGFERATAAEIRAYAGLSGLTIEGDYLDRPSVTLADAYAIAERRRRAEAEYAAAEVARRTEHAAAVESLQRMVNDEFDRARKAFAVEHAGQPWFGGADEAAGAAVNWGLESARAAWATAPAAARDQVTSVTYTDSGTIMTVPLIGSMPLAIISDYAHGLARKN